MRRFGLAVLAVVVGAQAALAQPDAAYVRKNARVLPALGRLPDTLATELAPYRAILLGEVYGTREAPRLALELARLTSRSKQHAWLGVDLPVTLQPAIDKFRASGDVSILKTLPFFQRPLDQRDGRASAAMGQLLTVSAQTPDLAVYCLDPEQGDHDAGMAREFTRHLAEHPGGVGVALVATQHARLGPEASMGYHLTHGVLPPAQVLAMDLRYQQGTAWGVTVRDGRRSAGVSPLTGGGGIYATAVPWGAYFLKLPGVVDGFNAVLFWRTLSASPPYVMPGAQPAATPRPSP